MINGKIWGTTECLFNHNGVECHRIFIKKGFACSVHSHIVRSNAFYVEKGALIIEVHKNDYELVDRTLLTDGKKTTAPAGEVHRFIALEDTIALEWYWVDDLNSDISRTSPGCELTEDELKEFAHEFNYSLEFSKFCE